MTWTPLQVVAHFKLHCILRVAGGWVRDKIMGLPSHDIDIAIDDQMGKDFAEKLSEYMKESGRGGEIGSVGVIKSNPDQSKHLETATVRVLGFELDFVNLRAEEYTDSRIPVMRIGTAEEDALRRDLTINALFYNINERSVEDYTGKGMEDIKSGTVRTPLAAQANLPTTSTSSPFLFSSSSSSLISSFLPHTLPRISRRMQMMHCAPCVLTRGTIPVAQRTMEDDPLRALRAVRFGARFRFQVAEDLAASLRSKDTHAVLASKVSIQPDPSDPGAQPH
jgi:tRNA nucleotidyltransferase/poly(A) polymerase